MRYADAMIAYTPNDPDTYDEIDDVPGMVRVGPFPDVTGWSKAYAHTNRLSARRVAPAVELLAEDVDAMRKVGIEDATLSRALLAIDEYDELLESAFKPTLPFESSREP